MSDAKTGYQAPEEKNFFLALLVIVVLGIVFCAVSPSIWRRICCMPQLSEQEERTGTQTELTNSGENLEDERERHDLRIAIFASLFVTKTLAVDYKIQDMESGEQELVDTTEQCCTICLNEYVGGDEIAYLPSHCGHVFHRDCTLAWFLKHDECPNCRVDYLSETN